MNINEEQKLIKIKKITFKRNKTFTNQGHNDLE